MDKKELYLNSIMNIASTDGRHCTKIVEFKKLFSEYALHKYRTLVELKHLIKMSEYPEFALGKLSCEEENELMKIFDEFDEESSKAIVEYDRFGRNGKGAMQHDVKSVEMFIREKLESGGLEKLIPWVHFGFTSEDVNNIAYNCMISRALNEVYIPKLIEVCDRLRQLAVENKKVAMLSRTHGQPASPTTFGKEMAVFLNKFAYEIEDLKSIKFKGKMNGAVGNYNAHAVAFPDFDWLDYSKDFVESFGFDVEYITNQRGPKRNLIKLFQNVMRINNILKDLDIDLWLYVSKNLLLQKKVEGEVGSSVMPHKINPWMAEGSESNTKLSNGLFEVFCRELNVSRLQRDLSDSNLERNYGTAFGWALISLDYVNTFLKRIYVNKEGMLEELHENSQVLAEAYQTILRAKGKADAYDVLKGAFRGNEKFNQEKINEIIDTFDIDDETKERMKGLKVEEYIGYSDKLVDIAVQHYDSVREN